MYTIRLKEFCTTYGVPMSVMRRALRSEYRNQIGKKTNQEARYNSPWRINVDRTIKLLKEGVI